jgi:hypothetical protein
LCKRRRVNFVDGPGLRGIEHTGSNISGAGRIGREHDPQKGETGFFEKIMPDQKDKAGA